MSYQQSLPYAQHHQNQPAQLPTQSEVFADRSYSMIGGQNGNKVDFVSFKASFSQMDRLINRWAADVVRAPPVPLLELCTSILNDIVGPDISHVDSTPMRVLSYLRHAMVEAISEGILNHLVVTNSAEVNLYLTRIHEHILAGNSDSTVASRWRQQTLSAADTCSPDMLLSILHEEIPGLMKTLYGKIQSNKGVLVPVLQSAHAFSRMLQSNDIYYRAYVPALGTQLYVRQIELVKRCVKSERGENDVVGATVYPGLFTYRKVTSGMEDSVQTVIRRAGVICECAMRGNTPPYDSLPPPYEFLQAADDIKHVPEKSTTSVEPKDFHSDRDSSTIQPLYPIMRSNGMRVPRSDAIKDRSDQASIYSSVDTITGKKAEDDQESAASIYSVAPSSTNSSDYGLYYRRMGLSEESLTSSLPLF